MYLIFNLDKILNPVVKTCEPFDVAVPLVELVEKYTDNTDETTKFLQKGTS